MSDRLRDCWALLCELWACWRDPNRVFFSDPYERYFARCTSCGRVFMHYWACVSREHREKRLQVGCPCGGTRMRIGNLPQWQQVWFMLSRYVWRKVVKRQTYWDPRMVVSGPKAS